LSDERAPRDTAVVTPSASRPGETLARGASSGGGATAPLPERLGPYEIRGTLGAGGMGVVYRGYDARLDRHVAVKTLPAELAKNPEFRERFLREARAMAKVVHRNVVQVHHAGEEGDTPYFAMEQIDGSTALELVRDEPLAVAVALDVVGQAATGLAAALERGLIHRDIKPSNLMRASDGTVKVLDFGLARAQSQARITATDIVMGSAEYMSPEQGRGEEPDHRSDIYALGGTLFHLLTGRPPFEGTSPLALIQKHIHEPCRRVDELRPEVPEAVCRLVEKMLAKDPKSRPQAYADLIAALRAASGEDPARAVAAQPLRAVPLGVDPGPIPGVDARGPGAPGR
jgi:serine/threonine protein kinase